MGATLVVSGVTGRLFYLVVRGRAAARTHMFRLSVVQTVVAAFVAVVSLARASHVSLMLAAAACVFGFAASKLIAGPGYALLYALYRAQRAYMDEAREQS
jgi:hypothetical protein